MHTANSSVQSVRIQVRTERTGILTSVQMTSRDGEAGSLGVSGGAIFRVTPDDGRALQEIGEDCR